VPQLFGSVAVAVQMPGFVPHTTSVATVQFGPQVPPLHAMPVGHCFPHAPQLFGSLVRSAHAPWALQSIWPVGHTHWPDTHAPPVSHAVPHAPQLLGSLEISTQPLPGQVCLPAGQAHAVTAGVPVVWHVAPCRQTLPQLPQLKLSVAKSTQAGGGPAQLLGKLEGQAHDPFVQVPPSGHGFPHALQSVALVWRF
jgi:hypothetical protein